jgi:DNA-binding beta-propeller fold protein YncE
MRISHKRVLTVFLLALILGVLCFAEDRRSRGSRGNHVVDLSSQEASTEEMASHKEVGSIGLTGEVKFDQLFTFCLDKNDNILACDIGTNEVKVISQDKKLLATWKLDFIPYAIVASGDGTVYIASTSVVAKLNDKGKVLRKTEVSGEDLENSKPSGIEVTDKDLFVSFGLGWSTRSISNIVRFDRDLNNPKTITEKRRGCCQRLDIVAKDGDLYIAENALHRVVKVDRNGEQLSKWGSRSREGLEGFGSCCNPMNLYFSKNGDLYTAESGLGRIKKYSPDGKFLGLVGYIGVDRFTNAGRLAASCSNITVAVNKDASKVYVLDFKNGIIRILDEK